MPISALLALPLLLAAPADPVNPIVQLHDALVALGAKAPVRAKVTLHLERRQGEGKEATKVQGEVQGQIALGPEGMQVSWPPAVLQQLQEEDRRLKKDPDSPSPTRDTVAALDLNELTHQLDAAPQLQRMLEQSELVESRTDLLDGVQRKLLVLQVDEKLPARQRKYVKHLEVTVRIWLGDDGLPVAAESVVKASGRAFLVVTFSSNQVERYTFSRLGDRLVALRHDEQVENEGAGESGSRHLVTTVEPIR